MKFLYTSAYSVGVEVLDRQHQHLFGLGNALIDAPLGEAKTYIMDLYQYIREHFTEEEMHMAEIGFSALPEHRELHAHLIDGFNHVIEKGINTEEKFLEFKNFLYRWLTSHIMKFDRRYFEYSKRHG